MKAYIYIVTLICSVFLLNGCSDEEMYKNSGEEVIEGIPTQVKLSFVAEQGEKIYTKSAAEVIEENIVRNLRVLIFDAQGNIELNREFSYEELEDKYEKESESSRQTSGAISVTITSGIKHIYAIANATGNPLLDCGDLSKIETLAEYKELTASMRPGYESIFRIMQGSFLMSGFFKPASDNGYGEGGYNITPETKTLNGSILLKRVDSRVRFNVKLNNSNATFTPKEWRVYNIPRVTHIYGKNTDAMQNESDYFDLNDDKPEMERGEKFESTDENGSSFVFYLLENRKEALDGEKMSSYEDREKQNKLDDGYDIEGDPKYKNGDYVHAPSEATYVEITGNYHEKYTDGGVTKERDADVKYTIHLGYAKNDYTDFSNERNKLYTYTITIEGVNNIRVEVTEDKENQPGAEGDIVETDNFFLFDAHYETDLIVFNKKAIQGKGGFRINTPFSKGSYDPVKGGSGYEDCNWVHFVRNDKSRNKYYTDRYKNYSAANLLTIEELLNELKSESLYDANGQLVYTVFVDEFYYTKHPVTGESVSWKEFVNKPNREMHILCNTDYSADQESSLTTSAVMISQRSIKTFYNIEDQSLTSAWGTETDNETGQITPGDNPFAKGTSRSNGRWNTYMVWGVNSSNKPSWNNYITSTRKSEVPRDHTKGSYSEKLKWACLQRNRDENGNGKVDAAEVKWYLASIDQLSDLWLGKEGLPVEAHLYQNGDRVYRRYASSSDGRELYAEEGASNDGWKFNYANSITEATVPTKFDYRCVRNLGFDEGQTPSQSREPMDYVSYNSGVFDLKYMNSNSIRTKYSEGELSTHNELSLENKPHKKFEVAMQLSGTATSWKSFNDQVTRGNSPCESLGEGWRLPNQRELLLMSMYCNDNVWNGKPKDGYIWSRTGASSMLTGKANSGYGGYWNYLTLPTGTGWKGVTRCVRDVK